MLPEKFSELRKAALGITSGVDLNRFLVRLIDDFETEFEDDLRLLPSH